MVFHINNYIYTLLIINKKILGGNSMKLKKHFLWNVVPVLIISAILVLLFSSTTFSQPEYEWRFGSSWTVELQDRANQLFCDLVDYYSDGRLKITLYPNGALGSHDEIFHAVQEGSVEMGVFSPYVNIVPGGLFNYMPWTIQNYNQAAVAFDDPDGILYKLLSEAWGEVGCHYLYTGVEGRYGIGNNVRPIKTPDDFKNLKLRVSSSLGFVRALQNMAEGTGMTVATVPWADLYTALERGVVDGCWSYWSSMVEERHFEVLDYYTALDWAWGSVNVVVNKELWNQLPSDLQEVMIKSGDIAEKYFYQIHRVKEADFIRTIEEAGVEIYYPTEEERQMFREKANMPAVWDELCKPWLDEHYPGENMTQKVLDELDRIREEY